MPLLLTSGIIYIWESMGQQQRRRGPGREGAHKHLCHTNMWRSLSPTPPHTPPPHLSLVFQQEGVRQVPRLIQNHPHMLEGVSPVMADGSPDVALHVVQRLGLKEHVHGLWRGVGRRQEGE